MLFSILSGGSIREVLIDFLLIIPVILISLSFHEAAHGYIAYKMGDRTAYNLGRVTLNPAKHLDLYGSLCMLVFGYGWAKPVPINTRNFKNPRNGMALTALAGPVTNLILGIIGAIIYALASVLTLKNLPSVLEASYGGNVLIILQTFGYYLGILNIGLMVFNLIPVPPFDGSRIFSVFLPPRIYFGIMRYERYIMYGILIVFLACSYLFDFSPVSWVASRLFGLIVNPIGNLFLNIFF
jgi:Zn-dependent protease